MKKDIDRDIVGFKIFYVNVQIVLGVKADHYLPQSKGGSDSGMKGYEYTTVQLKMMIMV